MTPDAKALINGATLLEPTFSGYYSIRKSKMHSTKSSGPGCRTMKSSGPGYQYVESGEYGITSTDIDIMEKNITKRLGPPSYMSAVSAYDGYRFPHEGRVGVCQDFGAWA